MLEKNMNYQFWAAYLDWGFAHIGFAIGYNLGDLEDLISLYTAGKEI